MEVNYRKRLEVGLSEVMDHPKDAPRLAEFLTAVAERADDMRRLGLPGGLSLEILALTMELNRAGQIRVPRAEHDGLEGRHEFWKDVPVNTAVTALLGSGKIAESRHGLYQEWCSASQMFRVKFLGTDNKTFDAWFPPRKVVLRYPDRDLPDSATEEVRKFYARAPKAPKANRRQKVSHGKSE